MTRANLVDLSRMPYGRAWELQKHVWQLRVAGRLADTLLLVEHPPVLTLGKSGNRSNLLVSETELGRRGIELFRVERGGDITYHGPGQLVGYPVFRLEAALAGVRRFVDRLQTVLIQALAAWSIRAESRPGLTGVWIGNDKIAALGIAVRRSVAFHGFALNVNTDVEPFRLIHPCGLTGLGVTTMAQLLGREVPLPTVKHQVAASFAEVFGLEFDLLCPDRLRTGQAG